MVTSSSLTIREAAPADAAAIADLWNAVIRAPHITFTTVEKTADAIAAMLAAYGEAGLPFLVAEAEGFAGFATYAPFRNGPGYLRTMEHSIHIAPEMHGRGVGRALMERLATEAAARGIHSLVAGISGDNPAAIGFHARVGFTEVGRVPEAGYKGERYLDLVLMQRLLG